MRVRSIVFGWCSLVGVLAFCGPSHAAFTSAACLAQKSQAAGNFQKCRAGEQAKLLLDKPVVVGACATKLQAKLAKLDEKAAKQGIACRYRDHGDGTVLDYDTGLQWELKNGVGGGQNLANAHDVDNLYTLSSLSAGCSYTGCPDGTAYRDFLGRLNNCTAGTGITLTGFASHCDWRIPSLAELQTIVDLNAPACGVGAAGRCIDAVFGPTAVDYWSATTTNTLSSDAYFVTFQFGGTASTGKNGGGISCRAVRGGY